MSDVDVQLQAAPLMPARTLSGLEHPAFPSVLAAAMPGVEHTRSCWPDEQDEHVLVDPATRSAVRVVIAWDRRQARARTWIGEVGPRRLWNEISARLEEWNCNGRMIPEHWLESGIHYHRPVSEPVVVEQVPPAPPVPADAGSAGDLRAEIERARLIQTDHHSVVG